MLILSKVLMVLLINILFWYILALIKKRNDIADIAWGFTFILLSWSSFYLSNFNLYSLLVNLLITIWGARLSFHIYLRNKNKDEDFRYKKWREEWKYFYLRTFLQVFLLQGLLAFLVVSPAIFLNINNQNITFNYLILGIIIWITGFIFESVSDLQLKKFISKEENKGKIMQTGLWKYSRHPNYFGEVLMWWGIFIITLYDISNIYLIFSPLLITYLIVYVSGIPMLEKKYENNVEYENYKKITSKFIPWFNKK